VNPSEIEKLANLARLKISDETIEETAKSITEVLALVDQLQAADTQGATPMAHPLDAIQRLRADNITEPNQREKFQQIAPATEDGLYLVPKVIE
jgi:aspartyl/glutamyl-tRNA(Asn/Gln) amidotransferase subunit C (EC 6.3.5.-)